MAARELIRGPAVLEFHYEPTGERRRAVIGPGMTLALIVPDPPRPPDEAPKVFSVVMDDGVKTRDG